MSMNISARLVFAEQPDATDDILVDVSVWKTDHIVPPCEFNDVSREATAVSPGDRLAMHKILSEGTLCIMCSTDNHRRTIGCTLFTASHAVARIHAKKPLLVRHPLNMKCVALVTFDDSGLIPTQEADTKSFALIDKCNALSQKLTSNTYTVAGELATSMGYTEAFFPLESGGTAFKNLLTIMPCTLMQADIESGDDMALMFNVAAPRIYMPMPLLEKLVEMQNSIVPLEWLAYNVYGACLIMNVNPSTMKRGDDLCQKTVHWPEFIEAVATLITCDPGFNIYFPDLAPAELKEEITIKNKRDKFIHWEPTESIQRPLSKAKMLPDDCEDWAMLLKMMSMAASYHKLRITNEELSWESELNRCELLSQLSSQSLEGIEVIIKHIAKVIDEKMVTVNMSCGVAGAPSLSKCSAGGQPGGHEFCFLYASKPCPGEDKCYASVVEGTNWTKTTHLPHKTVEAMNLHCLETAKGFGLDSTKIRPRGMQHIGEDGASVFESFWRTIVSLGGSVLVSVRGAGTEKAGHVVQWGANVGRLLRYFEECGKTETVAVRTMGEILEEPVFNGYLKGMRHLFNMVNLPRSDHGDFKKLSREWKHAVDFESLPRAFVERHEKHHNFFFHPNQSEGGHGVGFMGGFLYYAGVSDSEGA